MDETITEVREAEVPAISRSATVSSYSAEDNSVWLRMTTGARRTAYDYWSGRYYEEELVVNSKSVNTERLDAGTVQLLDNHQTYGGVGSIFGVVSEYKIGDGFVDVRVKLSNDPEKAGVVGDIRDGIIKAVSFGYSQDAVEVTDAKARTDGGKMPLYKVTRFTPSEVSMVTVPADPHAGTRGDEAPELPANTPRSMQRCAFTFTRAAAPIIPKEPVMTEEEKRAAAEAEAPRAAAQQAERERIANEARAAEQARGEAITSRCASVGLSERAAEYIRDGLTLEQVNDKIVTALAARDAAAGGHRGAARIQTVGDEHTRNIQGMAEEVARKINPTAEITDNGRRFAYQSLTDMGRTILEGLGVNTRGLSKQEVARLMTTVRAGVGMQTTGDFPSLMANVANKRLRAAYEQLAMPYRMWARRAPNLPDFKSVLVASLSGAPDLQQVNEHGEFKYGSVSDAGVTYQAITYGRIVPFTRQAIVNDDLRGFDRMAAAFGDAAARKQNALVLAQLTTNPLMADGNALFVAGHGNYVSTGTAISLSTLSDMRKSFRKQTGMAGEPLNLMARWLLVPSDQETVAYQYTSNNYQPTAQNGISPFGPSGPSPLQVIVDPMLDASSTTAWYGLADSAQADTVEFAFVDGSEGVVMDLEEGFDIDGIAMKARMDFAARAIDWRGAYKNNGA